MVANGVAVDADAAAGLGVEDLVGRTLAQGHGHGAVAVVSWGMVSVVTAVVVVEAA